MFQAKNMNFKKYFSQSELDGRMPAGEHSKLGFQIVNLISNLKCEIILMVGWS